jgi:hypothetical protein
MPTAGAMKTVFQNLKDLVPACWAVEVNSTLRHHPRPRVRPTFENFRTIRHMAHDDGSGTSIDEPGTFASSDCLLCMPKPPDSRDKDPNRAADRRPGAGAPSAEYGQGFRSVTQPGS